MNFFTCSNFAKSTIDFSISLLNKSITSGCSTIALKSERLLPFSDTFDKFMMARSKRVYRLIKWLLRKRIAKMSFKYSNSRNEENFIKYKTYRLLVLSKN